MNRARVRRKKERQKNQQRGFIRERIHLVTWSVVGALGTLLTTAAVGAQDRFNAEAFEPATSQETSVLSVYGTSTLEKKTYSLALMGSYARSPLSMQSERGEKLGDLVGSIGTLSLLGTIGIWNRLDLGLAVPIHRVSAGSSFDVAPPPPVQAALVDQTKIAMGDVRLVPRVSLIERKNDTGLGLAFLVPVSLPTGNDKYYVGDSVRVEPRMALDWKKKNALLAANVGYLVRKQADVLGSTVDDMLRWGLGADIPVGGGVSVLVEGAGALNVLDKSFSKRDAPTEALLGLRLRAKGILAQLGGGPGLIHGITGPQYRLFAALGFATEAEKPVLDSDHDGILDPQDKCPNEPEDLDGFEDQDGCPDLDNDRDGVPDAQDACPGVAEDLDGFEDHDGCPDLDNDKDGIEDAQDQCPLEAEDVDGFQDEDGCPDPDNDGDGVLDTNDQCPMVAGTAEHSGCPAPEPQKVAVTATTIDLNEKVFFQNNRAVIEQQSLPLMDEIAKVLKEHGDIKLVVVEGHTDDKGARARNAQLSKERAAAVVKALVERGVETSRLRAEGFGPDKPLVPNDSDEQRAQNRRVELRIVEREAAASPAP